MKPSAAYIANQGAGALPHNIQELRLDILSREVERKLFEHGIPEKTLKSTSPHFILSELKRLTYSTSLLEAMCDEDPDMPKLSPDELELAMCSIRDRIDYIRTLDNEYVEQRATRRATWGGWILLMVIGCGTFLFGMNIFQKTYSAATVSPYGITWPQSLSTLRPPASPPSIPQAPKKSHSANISSDGMDNGLTIFGDKDAPHRIDAWLSFSCPNCTVVWANLRDEIQDVVDGKDTRVDVHFVVPADRKTLTLAFYYEAILEQNEALAKDFISWVFDHQDEIKKRGLGTNAFLWMKEKLDFERFQDALKSKKLQHALDIKAQQVKKINLPGTPVLIVDGVMLTGSEITPENIHKNIKGD